MALHARLTFSSADGPGAGAEVAVEVGSSKRKAGSASAFGKGWVRSMGDSLNGASY